MGVARGKTGGKWWWRGAQTTGMAGGEGGGKEGGCGVGTSGAVWVVAVAVAINGSTTASGGFGGVEEGAARWGERIREKK